jgi:putative endonuclease
MRGAIYLLHFSRPVGNPQSPRGQARHYIGWSLDPEQRNAEHRAGRGAALTRAAAALGIDWQLFILAEGDRTLERRVKALKAAPRLCPVCGRSHPGGRLHVRREVEQLAFDLDDDWPPLPAGSEHAPMDRYELLYTRAWGLAAARCYDLGNTGGDLPY